MNKVILIIFTFVLCGFSLYSNGGEKVEESISWESLIGQSSNTKLDKITIKEDKIIIRKSLKSMMFLLPLFAPILIFLLFAILTKRTPEILISIVLITAISLFFFRPKQIDMEKGYFYKGYIFRGKGVNLVEAKGIQYLSKEIDNRRVGKSLQETINYYSFEVNLVLKDNSRINLFYGGKGEFQLDEARRLSEKLNIPLFTRH